MEPAVLLRAAAVLGADSDAVDVRRQRADADLGVLRRAGRGRVADRGEVGAVAHVALEDRLVATLRGARHRGDVAPAHELSTRVDDREARAAEGLERARHGAERRLLDRGAADAIGADVRAGDRLVAESFERIVLFLISRLSM